MPIFRIIWSIFIGFTASGLWSIKRGLRLSNESAVALAACRTVVRMYGLGFGIDDGAAYLYSTWGPDGRASMRYLIERASLTSHQVFYAKILAGYETGDVE